MKNRIYYLLLIPLFFLVAKPSYAATYTYTASQVYFDAGSGKLSLVASSPSHPFNTSSPIGSINIYNSDQSVGCGDNGSGAGNPYSTTNAYINLTQQTLDLVNGGDCASITDMTGMNVELENNGNFYESQTLSSGDLSLTFGVTPPPTPTPNEPSLSTEQKASVAAVLKSIPDTAVSEVFAIYPVTIPYLLIIVAIGIFFVMWQMMKNYNNNSNDPVDTSSRNTLWEKDYNDEYELEMSTGKFTEEEANNNATTLADNQDTARNNGSV